eukprot:jgi/Tetstr1/447887/TSEL_035196.t1
MLPRSERSRGANARRLGVRLKQPSPHWKLASLLLLVSPSLRCILAEVMQLEVSHSAAPRGFSSSSHLGTPPHTLTARRALRAFPESPERVLPVELPDLATMPNSSATRRPLMDFMDANQPCAVSVPSQTERDPENTTPYDGHVYRLPDGTTHALLRPAGDEGRENHAPYIAMLPSGDLYLVWFWGFEGRSGVAIVGARLQQGAACWSELAVISVEEGRSAQNPVLMYHNGSLILMHTSQAADEGQGTSLVYVLTSPDEGRSWTAPRPIITEKGAFVRAACLFATRPFRPPAAPGEWLLPMYYTPDSLGDKHTQYSALKWSADPAHSWPLSQTANITLPGQALAQPAITRLRDGSLLALLRDRWGSWLYYATSSDEGRSWGAPWSTGIINNNKAVAVHTLLSGTVALLFTNSHKRSNMWPVSLALSEDGGATFPHVRDLQERFDTTYENAEFSYPTMVWCPGLCGSPAVPDPSGQGSLHMAYTYSKGNAQRTGIRYLCVDDVEAWARSGAPSKGTYRGLGDRFVKPE